MFKKPLANLKSSAPLRSSDRRKLKQRVLVAFSLPAEDGDLLVPEGILTAKFITHNDVPGVAYISAEGDPLWMSIGKGSDELIPSVYTLWKKPTMIPFICTPSPVIPILVGGADLMIPGVMFHSESLVEGQLVAICQYERKDGTPMMSAPLAVGRMAVHSDTLKEEGGKGKATITIHTWKDKLWDSGSKRAAPDPTPIGAQNQAAVDEVDDGSDMTAPIDSLPQQAETSTTVPESLSVSAYTKEEISALLRISLIQAISKILCAFPASTFPIPLSTFYSTYVLPSRPAFPSLVVPSAIEEPNPQDISLKASSHKSLTTFIKAAEKENLVTTKAPQKHAQQAELVITSVNLKHPVIQGHTSFVTVGDIDSKAAKKAQRQEQEREKEALAQSELEARELWKPHQATIELFRTMKASTSDLYTVPEVRALVSSYIVSRDIVNPHDKAYINLDEALRKCVLSKGPSGKKPKDGPSAAADDAEFLKRDDLYRKIIERMQTWHEVRGEGKDVILKKGPLSPIQVIVKVRNGKKSTLVSGIETFFIVAEDMAQELKKTCAGSTSVSPGKGAGASMEVLVQGKQVPTVLEYLRTKGVPKRCIEVVNSS